jgi:hypothetical protein
LERSLRNMTTKNCACFLALLTLLSGLRAAPFWENDAVLEDGWRWNEWFGHYKPLTTEWLYHLEHEWLYVGTNTPESLWFYDFSLGWIWTNVATYPYLTVNQAADPWYYYKGTRAPRYFTDTATGWAMTDGNFQVIELASKATGTAATSLSAGDGISISIPAAVAAATDTMSIAALASVPPENAPPGMELGTVIEFSLGQGEGALLPEPVTLSIPYDPSRIPQGVAAEDALGAGYYDASNGVWVQVPCTVDPESSTLTIETNHLSLWTGLYLATGYEVWTSPDDHFKLVYDPSKSLIVGTSQWSDDQYRPTILSTLENAWTVYENAGFDMPDDPVWLHLFEPGVNSSYYSGKTGNIYLAGNFDSEEHLKHDLAHEFFHMVQLEYFSSSVTMGLRKWWVEACADYAAEFVAGHYEGQAQKVFKSDYFSIPLDTVDGVHEYATANFVKFLLSSLGVSFRDLWEGTGSKGIGPMTALRNYCHSKNAILNEEFTAFVRETLLGGESLLSNFDIHELPPLQKKVGIPDNGEALVNLVLKGPHCAAIALLTPPPGLNETLPVKLTLSDTNACFLEIHRIPEGINLLASGVAAETLSPGENASLNISGDEHLLLLVHPTETSSSTKYPTVRVETSVHRKCRLQLQ